MEGEVSKSIVISIEVWEAIAARGKFGETEDDVLRRVFDLPPRNGQEDRVGEPAAAARVQTRPRRSFATDRMSAYISGNELRVSFSSGPSGSWKLPSRDDKNVIRAVRDQATSFAEKHGATLGQINAVKKALTDSGYYVIK